MLTSFFANMNLAYILYSGFGYLIMGFLVGFAFRLGWELAGKITGRKKNGSAC